MRRDRGWIPLFLAVLVTASAACGTAPTPTPRPATPTLVAFATLTPSPAATPTTAPSPTSAESPTLAVTATPTRTNTVAVTRPPLTPTPRGTPTVPPPPRPRGSIAYHLLQDGVNRTFAVSLDSDPYKTTPLFAIGPVMDLTKGTFARWGEWSPDNARFAYILTSGQNASQVLRVYTFSNGQIRDLDSSDGGRGGLSSPTWSPDGRRIGYIRVSGDERVWIVRSINSDQTGDVKDVRYHSQGEQYRGGLSWGRNFMFAFALKTTGASDIYAMDINGAGLTNLTNHAAEDLSPAWSPDGKQIAFTSLRDGHAQIYLMNADGSGTRRPSRNNFTEFGPSWSPDGNWIAFTSTRDGIANIHIMDRNGSNIQRITTNGGDHPIWSR